MNRFNQRSSGQAMSEFLICTSFVLLPLFLGISLLAKYIDMKQTTIQAARYQAWEYTVWYANSSEPMSGFNAVDQPIKSTLQTREETEKRFFSYPFREDTSMAVRYDDYDTGWQESERNRLWTNHKGEYLYDETKADAAEASLVTSEPTPTIPIVGDFMNILFDIVDFAFSALGDLMSLIGSSVGFTAINTDGYAKTTAAIPVLSHPEFIDISTMSGDTDVNISALNPGNLVIQADAGVLTDGWNAGGVEHTYNQAGGTVPTVLLGELLDAIPGFNEVWSVVTILSPELRLCNPGWPWPDDDKGSLWLGHIDIDAVHPDRLSGGGTHECDDAGICKLVPNIPRDEDDYYCID